MSNVNVNVEVDETIYRAAKEAAKREGMLWGRWVQRAIERGIPTTGIDPGDPAGDKTVSRVVYDDKALKAHIAELEKLLEATVCHESDCCDHKGCQKARAALRWLEEA